MPKGLTVVLEGPDGAGKTTLARALQDRYASGYQHAGPPFDGATPASLTREYVRMLGARELLSYDPTVPCTCGGAEDGYHGKHCDRRADEFLAPTVLDRWALGETVYGPLFRGRSLIGPTEWRALASLLDSTCTPLVLCLPPRQVALENWQRNVANETFKDRQQVLRAYEAYASWAHGGQPHLARPRWTWIYDYTRPAEDEFFHFLDALAEKQR